MNIRHQHRPDLIIFKTKIIKEYGLEVRNDGYSEHAISIHRSIEKIKDAFPFQFQEREAPDMSNGKETNKAASKNSDFIQGKLHNFF